MFTWFKSHPKLVLTVGAMLVSLGGSLGLAPESVEKVLRAIAGFLGIL